MFARYIFTVHVLIAFLATASCTPKESDQLPPLANTVNLKELKTPVKLLIEFPDAHETQNVEGLKLGFTKLDVDSKSGIYQFLDVDSIVNLKSTSKQELGDVIKSEPILNKQGRGFMDVAEQRRLIESKRVEQVGGTAQDIPVEKRTVDMYDARLTNAQSAELMQSFVRKGDANSKGLDLTPLLGTKVYPDLPAEKLSQMAEDINASRIEGIFLTDKEIPFSEQEINFLRQVITNDKIKEFTFINSGSSSLGALAQFFNGANRSIEKIQIYSNNFGVNVAGGLANIPNLKSLSLAGNLSSQEFSASLASLASNSTLKTFHLDIMEAPAGFGGVLKSEYDLESFSLFIRDLTPNAQLPSELRTMFMRLGSNKTLTSLSFGVDRYYPKAMLDFAQNEVRTAMVDSLKMNKTLTSLSLPGLALPSGVLQPIIHAMKDSQIIDLDVRGSRLEAFQGVSRELVRHGKFTRLDFSGSEFHFDPSHGGLSQIDELVDVIQGNPNLAELKLSDLRGSNSTGKFVVMDIPVEQVATLAAAASGSGRAKLTIDIRRQRPHENEFNDVTARVFSEAEAAKLQDIAKTYPNVQIKY